MSVLEKIKEHPGLVVGGIAFFLVVLYFVNHAGGGATTTGALDTTNSVDAATAYQTAQLGAAAQANQVAAALQAHEGDTAAQLDIAKLNFGYMSNHDALAAGVANKQLDTNADTTRYVSMLEAGVQTSAINAQTENTRLVTTAQVQQQGILADALTRQNFINASVATSAIKCTGLRSIFGC